jgi:hypothetical protein
MIKMPESTEDVVVKLLRLANTKLPADVGWALEARPDGSQIPRPTPSWAP